MAKRKRSVAGGASGQAPVTAGSIEPKLDSQEAFRQLRALRGKVDVTIDLPRLREDRTFGHDEA